MALCANQTGFWQRTSWLEDQAGLMTLLQRDAS
jgi:hypothetical protein